MLTAVTPYMHGGPFDLPTESAAINPGGSATGPFQGGSLCFGCQCAKCAAVLPRCRQYHNVRPSMSPAESRGAMQRSGRSWRIPLLTRR